jgi:hypothetical protein
MIREIKILSVNSDKKPHPHLHNCGGGLFLANVSDILFLVSSETTLPLSARLSFLLCSSENDLP